MSSLTIVLIVRALFGSCPSAKNGRGDKDMAENNVGSAEQYEDSGRWRWIVLLFNQTINWWCVIMLLSVCSRFLLFPFGERGIAAGVGRRHAGTI